MKILFVLISFGLNPCGLTHVVFSFFFFCFFCFYYFFYNYYWDFDTTADGVSLSFSYRGNPLVAATDQDENMGRSFESNFEVDVGSTERSYSIASNSFSDIAPGSMNEEQMVSVGSATDGDDVSEAAKLNVESTGTTEHNLAIVTHVSHILEYGRDTNEEAVNSDEMPL